MSHAHTAGPDYGTGKKKLSLYIMGITLCIILTLVPFGAVMYHWLSQGATFVVIFTSAILQFLVQVICFLRLNTDNHQARMNVMAFVFTIVILVVIVGGSLWIMAHLHYNMMH